MFMINRDIPILSHSMIVEWDIKSANTSVMRSFKLVPDGIIDKLDELDKGRREVKVGLMMRKNKEFSKSLEKGFNDIVTEFIKVNNIRNDQIISIKRDAVFIRSKEPTITKIRDCLFRRKGIYDAYLYSEGIELYHKAASGISSFDVKGISDENIPLHENGLLEFFGNFLGLFNYENQSLGMYCKDYVSGYKNRELVFDHYREFNASSLFRMNYSGYQYTCESVTESTIQDLDISFNYLKHIIPTIQYLF